MRWVALFFIVLTLLLSVQMDCNAIETSLANSCCHEEGCKSESEQEPQSEPQKGICNPFQCHSCCLIFVSQLPCFDLEQILAWPIHSAFYQNITYPQVQKSIWQPPKLV